MNVGMRRLAMLMGLAAAADGESYRAARERMEEKPRARGGGRRRASPGRAQRRKRRQLMTRASRRRNLWR